MKILYYDCFSGISGDMNLGALIDLGVDKEYLKSELSKLDVGGYEIHAVKDVKSGISGTKVDVILKKSREYNSHHNRNLNDIENIVDSSSLSSNVKNMSLEIFKKVAEAEAKVHNKPMDEIHFHEVGAVDSIVDIVGAAICIDYLKIDRVEASKVEVGSGFVKCAHGVFPVPAPATAEILRNIPIKSEVPFEATTPTGAAILTYLSSKYTENKSFKINKIGYGIGHENNERIPDVLRVFLGETDIDDMQVIECNIDDMNPEIYQYVIDALLKSGASDVYLTPIIMKKGRPAVKLTVLCKVEVEENIKDIILTQTTTLGFRKYRVQRDVLDRDFTKVVTKYGEVSIKNAYYKGKNVKSKIEYEDCKKLAIKNKVSIQEIYREAAAELLKQGNSKA
ncbi:MAG TPA: nickel pincer cofactor biosynthesis protein LarC [Clostridium sp.]|jgi:hypothetical protein|nr:nickel pincer cofactor biosynthesis protein LarC [Clostridium sp.]